MPVVQLRRIAILAAALAGVPLATGAQQASGLRYRAPAGWQETRDPETQLVSLTAPGGGASVTFAASSEYAGTAEQWHTAFLNDLKESMPLASPQTVPGEQGAFQTSMGVFRGDDGALPWICLYTLVDRGRGEAVLFMASGEQQFFANLETVNNMIYGVTVGGTAAPATTRAAPPPAAPPVSQAAPPAARPQPAAASPGSTVRVGDPLPTIEFTMAQDFFGGTGPGFYSSLNGDATIGVYTFRQFSGDFAQTFNTTLFRDWITGRQQERAVLQRSALQPFAVAGAEQALFVQFSEEYFGGTPREHIRAAILAGQGVAIVDISMQDAGSLQRYSQQISQFLGSLRVVGGAPSAAPPVSQASPPARQPVSPQPAAAAPGSTVRVGNALPTIEFTMAQDFFGGTGPGFYNSLNGDASIGVYAFRQFSGDFAQTFNTTLFRDWITGRQQERAVLQRTALQPFAVAGAEQALFVQFSEEYFGGTPREHIRAAILAGQAVSIVDISMQDAGSLQRYSQQIGQFLGSLRIVGAAPSAAPAPGPASSQSRAPAGAPTQGSFTGLYIASKQQFQPNPFGGVGSGTWVMGTESYLFSANGYVYRTQGLPQAPGGDTSRFDFAAAQRADPANTGTYSVNGNQVIIRFDAAGETVAANRTAADTLEIYGVAFKRGE